MFSEIPNLEGHQNRCIGLKVTVILMIGWILLFGGASSGRVCAQPAKQACSLATFLGGLKHWLCNQLHLCMPLYYCTHLVIQLFAG